ncbi:P-loop containing nucleoside triphosphate hydrolase protein [Rhizophagus irregularis]|uniref:RNA helicase n=1 Tax=Rhizophagus irregularis TaxID=588596 RepID=A0A2N0SC62_9GLOM|nr:P-loop containing nucleoside triphosphate hydrolase protein [Rhizophagus irregularis]
MTTLNNNSSSSKSKSSQIEPVAVQATLEDVAAGINRVENVLLDLTKQIIILNENISTFLNQQLPQSSNGHKTKNLVHQLDVQQTEIKRSTSIRTYHKDTSDSIGNLTLQVATLSTSVAQLVSQQQQQQLNNVIALPRPPPRIPRWDHDPYRNLNHRPPPRIISPRRDSNNSVDKGIDDVIEKFENMRLRPELLRGILNYGLDRPSSVQQRGIPLLLKGQDVIAQAKAGKEKYATYCIPILQNMELQSMRTQALIITSTNETAGHIYRLMLGLSTLMHHVECMLCISGGNIGDDVKKAQKRPHIIIGTPNRICDLVNLDAIDLSYLKMFIVDDAEHLLIQGFKEHAIELRKNFPKTTIIQTIIFSGSVNTEIMDLTTSLQMREPVRILVKKNEQNLNGVRHYYLYVAMERSDWKFEALADLLESIKNQTTIIYCNKESTMDSICYKLCERDLNAIALYGEVGSSQRDSILDKFKSGKNNILITTEVLIDIDLSVQLVIHFELPSKPEDYGKRITLVSASGSYQGVSISFVTSKVKDMSNLRAIESLYKIKMPEMPINLPEIL